VAIGLFLKTVLGDMIGFYSSGGLQIVLATSITPFALICLLLMRRIGSDEYLVAFQSHPLPKRNRQNLLYFFVTASVIVAALRGFSHLGLWGNGYFGSSIPAVPDYAVVGLILAGFTYVALVRNSDDRMLKRYQPAFLVLISGFLVYVVVMQFASSGTNIALLTDYFVSAELFGHLLLRSVVFTATRTDVTACWRIQGLSDTAYGITAIIWGILLQDAIVSVQLLIIVALFFSMAAAIRPLSRNPYETEIALSDPSGTGSDRMPPASGTSADEAGTKVPENASIVETLNTFLLTLAKRAALSSRETEVFLLLAQGRSRPYISQVLFLSDGTVKTHISHIYRKFGVSSRQELLTVIEEYQNRG